MKNSLADDVVFILMEFRNAPLYSNELFKWRDFIACFASLDLSNFCYCVCNQKNKETFNGL